MIAKPMKTLELHYPMIQFLISMNIICETHHSYKVRVGMCLPGGDGEGVEQISSS